MTLDKEQTEAVNSTAPLTLVVAGPGSGKTRVITERILHVLRTTKPKDIVAITFTNDAANEIRRRLGGTDIGFCGTLHAYLLRLLRKHGPGVLGMPALTAVIDEDTAKEILLEEKRRLACRESWKAVEEAAQTVPMLQRRHGVAKGAELVSAAYHTRLLRNGMLSYDTILAFGLYLLQCLPADHMESEHVLVDEVQDSGQMDWDIYLALKTKNLFLVGDPDQSIYGFRGAVPDNLLRMANGGRAKVIWLQNNYRSTVAVCAAANNIIRHNIARLPKVIAPVRHEAGRIEWNEFGTEMEEATVIAQSVKNNPLVAIGQVAVLVRTNRLVRMMSQTLTEFGVPVNQHATTPPPKDWNVARLALAFMSCPDNNIIAHRFLVAIWGKDRAMDAYAGAATAMKSINDFAISYSPLPMERVCEYLAKLKLLTDTGGEQSLSNESVWLVEKAIKSLPGEATMSDLTLRCAEEINGEAEATVGVNVSTIHSAKGLEWDEVFLPFWTQEAFPGAKAAAPGKEYVLEEARRMAFVASTRARNVLRVSWSRQRKEYELARHLSPATASQFVQEGMEA